MSHLESVAARAEQFRALHDRGEIFVCPNPWDVGTARILENMGFRALATTSAGLAFSLGRRDGDGAVSAEETFRHAEMILASTSLPVSADLEDGFGASPDQVAATIRRAGEIGLAGGSIEDATYAAADPLYSRSLAVERIAAAVEAARGLPYEFTLTARTEGFIRGRPDLDETMRRLSDFENAGADVLYAPGLPTDDAIRRVCESLNKPFNYVVGIGPTRPTLARLAELGVRRVTIGTSLVRSSLDAFVRAAREILGGTFTYVDSVPTVADFNNLIAPAPSADTKKGG